MDEKLKKIIDQMVRNGESDAFIKKFIGDYKSKNKQDSLDLGKPEAVQDAAPVTAEEGAVGTDLVLESGSLDSQGEVESKSIKNPNVGSEGEFAKAYDPYNDFNNIMPLSFSKVNPEKLTEMRELKGKELEVKTNELKSLSTTLREQSDYIKEESNRINNAQYNTEEERKSEVDFFNSFLSDYNKKLGSFKESVRQHEFQLNKFNDSSKFIDWANKQEQEYIEKEEKINFYKDRDAKLAKNIVKYGAGGLAVTFGEEIFGAAANMTERFIGAGGAGYLALNTSVSSDEEIEENYQKRIKDLQEDGLSKDRAIAIADASRKVINIGNERMKESKKNLLQFANERIKSADDRAKAMNLIENYGDIRDGNIFDWVSFASGAMAEQIPTMVITRASFGTATYALTTGSMYQEVYNSVVDGYKKEGFSEEEAMDKALTDERVNKTILHAAGVLVAGLDFVGQGSVFGKGASNAVKKKVVAEAIEGMTARGVLRQGVKGQSVELVTELWQEGIEMEGTSLSLGKSFGEGFKEMTVEDVKNLVAKITFGTSGGTVYKAINNQAEYKNIAKIIKKDPILKNFALEQIDAKVLNGEFSEAKGNLLKTDLQKIVRHAESFDGIIPEANMDEALRVQEEIDNLEKQIETNTTGLDKMLKSKLNEEKAKLEKLTEAPAEEQAEISQEEAQKADIEKRRQEELKDRAKDIPTKYEQFKDINGNDITKVTYKDGSSNAFFTESGNEASKDGNLEGLVETNKNPYKIESAKERGKGKLENKINAKYDAELAALGETTPSGKVSEEDTKSEEPVSVETAPLEIKVPEKFNNATVSVSKGESINEVELEDSINEAYDYLSEIENDNSKDAEIMRSLVEDEIEKLENYDNITETQTRKIAEEKTVRTVKKTPRKTIPKREKDFVGKKATYSDNKGAGGRGSIIIQEGPDGRDYYVIEQADDAKVILGRRDKAFSDGVVNFDENNNPASVTFPMSEGKQVTVKDPAIAQEFELEQMKQPEYDEQIFEETYIEFVGEEKVEVPKPKESKTKVEPKPKPKLTGKAKVIDEFSETPKFKKETEEKLEEDTRNEVESVVEEMNQMSDEVANFEVPSNLSTKEKSKLSSLVSRFSNKIKKLWKGGIIKDISKYNGIPFLFTISDQLSSGATVNPFTGNTIDLKGGLGFTFTEGNEKNGWANTEEGKADDTVKFALEVYNSNKPLFDRLWKEGKLPYGHVPMAIVKMGQDSILSNEALFRVAADTIKTHFSEQERENSLNGLVEDIQDLAVIKENNKRKNNDKEPLTDAEEKLIRDKVLSKNAVIKFINDNKFTTIDELLENLNKLTPITKRVEVSSILFTGSVGKDTTPGKPKKKSALALVEGKPKDFYKYVHIQQLNNIIKEEATKNIPSAHIIGITSVDVLNPKVEKTNHRNYPFGPKGQMIGLLESPVHVADVFPEAYSRAIAMAKEDKAGKLADTSMAVRQAVAASGAVATMKILRGAKLSDKISDFQKLVAKLRAAFPSVVVVDSAQEFNNKLKDPNINKFVKDGDTVYGFTYDGKIFINPELKNLNTPLHEFGHIWLGFLKENNPALLEKGYKLLEGTELLKRKIEEFGDTELAREEAMAESIASRGEVLIDASKISKFKEWLSGVFNYLKKKIKGFESMSADEIQNMTLEEFVDKSLAAMLSGKEITSKQIKSIGLKFSKGGRNFTIDDVIKSSERENLTRKETIEVLQELGFTKEEIRNAIPASPSVSKVLGKPKKKKVVVDEMSALKTQLRLEAKAARDANTNINKKRKQLASLVKDFKKRGKITANQARTIINKISSVNVYNSKSIESFIDYIEKIYNNADYADKFVQSMSLRSKIKKSLKNKKTDAKLIEMAKMFESIDPKFIENIDEYIENANSVLQGIRTSKVVGTDIKWRMAPNLAKANKYIESKLKEQREKILEIKRQEFESILGVSASDLSYDEMMLILSTDEEVDNKKETLIRKAIDKAFNTYKVLINSIISNGVDPFTGETVSSPNKKIIKEFMEINLSDLTVREAIESVDALNNYIINGTTSGMGRVVAIYRGAKNTKQLVGKGLISKALRLFGSKNIARISGFQITSMTILFERLFKGQAAGREVSEAIGLDGVVNGVAKARKIASKAVDSYVNDFKNKKPNGKKFNDSYNITERGLVGVIRRTVVGEKLEQSKEFDRQKVLLKQTIEKLKNGTEKEKIISEEYQKVFDNILKNANSIEDVDKAVDKINLKAVKFWNKQFASIYDQLYDVSLNIYNDVLGSDINYIPVSMKSTSLVEDKEFNWDSSSLSSVGNSVYQKKSGTLEKSTRPKNLPKNKYISLDFDTNMANIFEAAMIDVETAESIQQVKGAIESKYFSKLIESKEDRDLLERRIISYIRRVRGKDIVDRITSKDLNEAVNFIGKLGVARALGGITQIPKQTIPVAINTLINTGGILDLKAIGNADINKFIDKSGYAIANRGISSQSTIESVNKSLKEAKKSTLGKLGRFVENASDFWLETFLVNPDVAIARVSWISYYQKYLKNQKIDTKNIDWNTHKLNKEAANYAQQQVDRQQNVSDSDLQGEFLTNKNPEYAITRKVLIPFMSFSLNQKARMYSDAIVLTSKTSSSQDKVAASISLAGLGAEMAAFYSIRVGIALLMFELASKIMGYDEPEEEKEKRIKNQARGIATSITQDLLTPFPKTEVPIIGAVNYGLNLLQSDTKEKERFLLFNDEEQDYIQSLGTYGITASKVIDTKELMTMAFSDTYTNKYGTKKKLPEDVKNILKIATPMSIGYNVGLLPSEFGSLTSYMKKIAEKQSSSVKNKPLLPKEKSLNE